MKRVAAATLLLLLSSAPAWAGAAGVMFSYVSTDQADDDDGLGLKLDLDMGPRADFEIRASFFDNLLFPEEMPLFELETVAVDVGIGYDFPARRATPYLGGGLSYLFINSDTRPEPPAVAAQMRGRVKEEIGWYALGGVEVAVGRASEIFFEAGYRTLEAEIQGEGLQSFEAVGLDLSGGFGNIGIQIAW